MRISTSQIFSNGLAAINKGFTALAKTQQQLSSGKRIQKPSDDPAGAIESLRLRDRISTIDQFARNARQATGRLQQEEVVLKEMGDAMQRARELTVQAANATQSNESRKAIAQELRQIEAALLSAANTRDSNGEYIFAGFRSANKPFIGNASGVVEYFGDGGQRLVGIAPDRTVADGDNGEVFMTIPRGNGVFVVTPAAANTGMAWATTSEVVDPAAVTPTSFTIQMTTAASYDVLDAGGAVVSSGTFVSGQAIDIGGRRIVLTGQAAAGDSFAVTPAGSDSVFAMIDELASALETARGTAAAHAQLDNSTGIALQNLDQMLGRVIELRTDVGARLHFVERNGLSADDHKVHLETALSAVEDLNYAEAVGRLTLQQAALEAAQQTYVRVGRLSLFDFLR